MFQYFFDSLFGLSPASSILGFSLFGLILLVYCAALLTKAKVGLRRIILAAGFLPVIALILSIGYIGVARKSEGWEVFGALGIAILVGNKLPQLALLGVLLANIVISLPGKGNLTGIQRTLLIYGPLLFLLVSALDLSARLIAYRSAISPAEQAFLSFWQIIDRDITFELNANWKAPQDLKDSAARTCVKDLFGGEPTAKQLSDYFSRFTRYSEDEVNAIQCISNARLPQAIEPLGYLASGPQRAWASYPAIQAITKIGGPDAIKVLSNLLSGGNSWEVRRAVLEGLVQLQDLDELASVTSTARSPEDRHTALLSIASIYQQTQNPATAEAAVRILINAKESARVFRSTTRRNPDVNTGLIKHVIQEMAAETSDNAQLQNILTATAGSDVYAFAQEIIVPRLFPEGSDKLDCAQNKEICDVLSMPSTDILKTQGCSYLVLKKDAASPGGVKAGSGGGGMPFFDFKACLEAVRSNLKSECRSIDPPEPVTEAMVAVNYAKLFYARRLTLSTPCSR